MPRYTNFMTQSHTSQKSEDVQNSTKSNIHRALDGALDRSTKEEAKHGEVVLDINRDKFIILSDQHRGTRTRADDFRYCEQAYNAALAYYNYLGYTLVVLGDVEELWEDRPQKVIAAYPHTYELESLFHRDRRYIRIWGNHDDDWQFADMVQRLLAPIYGSPHLHVYEGRLIKVMDGEERLGTIFLTHGHQGTRNSDRFAFLARFFVRFLYRPWQRLTNYTQNTPSRDWSLRDMHNVAMYQWALSKSKLVLICGHTHRPIFGTKAPIDQLRKRLSTLKDQAKVEPEDEVLREEIARLAAKIESIRTQQDEHPKPNDGIDIYEPCYFNSGCCCFYDGQITGIEIAKGEIRLVSWPGNMRENPSPKILLKESLREVFNQCT